MIYDLCTDDNLVFLLIIIVTNIYLRKVEKQATIKTMSQRLRGKVAVITGAASGIGQGVAILFVEQGATVILIDIRNCDDTISKIDKSLRKNVLFIKCDISNESNIISASKLIKTRVGIVDILINNACRFIFHSVLSASDKDWNNSLSVNIKGHALMMKHIVPIMKKGNDEKDNIGGSIIMMCSVSSYIAQPKCITYSATKAAMLQITKNTALDLWNDYKIRVNAVCPGTIFTPASVQEMTDHGWSRKEWEGIKSKEQIIKRSGTVREVGYACLFFASDESKFCTGSSLMVDGGQTAL